MTTFQLVDQLVEKAVNLGQLALNQNKILVQSLYLVVRFLKLLLLDRFRFFFQIVQQTHGCSCAEASSFVSCEKGKTA